MAITRAQIPEQIDIFQEGGDVTNPPRQNDPYTDLYKDMLSKQSSYDTNFQKYLNRLSQHAQEKPRMNIFEVASELGRGLLSTPNTGVGSTYQGLGVGFDNISQRIQADKKMYEDQKREIQMMATQLAMQDEQKAEEFLNQIALKRIDAANKDVDYITLEYDEVVGDETVTKRKRIADTPQNAAEISDLFTNNNAREIKPATTQINLPGGEKPGDSEAIKQIFKDQESFGEKAEASNATLDQVDQARALALEVGEDNFGPFNRTTLQAREFISGIGLGDWLESEEVIAPQKALNQLSMSFTMGIVSQTKGAISDREMKLFIQASPTLGSTYAGYMKQLELLERLAARDADFYADYLDKSMELVKEGVGPREQQLALEKFAATWKRNNPLFTREETKSLQDMVEGGDGGFEGAGLAEDFDRDAWEEKMNELKSGKKGSGQQKTVSGIPGVPDGSTFITEVGGVKFYLKPGGDVNNKDDIIKVE